MFSSDKWFGSTPSFYNGVISQSLRLSVGSNYKLDRQMVTPTSVTGTICTASWWMKKSAHGTVQSFIQCRDNQSSGNYAAYWTYDTGFGGNDHHAFRNEVDSLNLGTDTSVVPYRDAGGWYHVVIRYDSTQSTAADRIRIYKNGTLQNSNFATTTYPSQNHVDTYWNNAGEHLILFGNGEDSGDSFDGYIAEFNWVDGQSLPPETFGELKNGVWIPKKITLSTSDYGLNGSRYTFADSSDIGKDTSGVGNDLDRVSNLSAHDVVPDSPENNFCTFNSIGRRYGQSYIPTFSEGNLKAASGGNASHTYGTMAINQIASQGGVYFEVRLDSQDTSRTYVGVFGDTGVNNKASNSNAASYSFPIKGLLRPSAPDGSMAAYFGTDTDGSGSTDLSSHVSTYSNGDILGVAILSDGKTFFHKNGTYIDDASGNVGNPSTGANPTGTIDLTEGDFVPYVGYNSTFSINFGQDSTFAGQESSGGNSDANGIGDFAYAVPTNCLAICSSNMAEPTIGPNSDTQADDHFDQTLFDGTGSSPLSITGMGHKPDLLWLKRRDNATNGHHILYDSTRGGTNALRSSTNSAEAQFGDMVITFASDGFSFTGTDGLNASSSYNNVAWSWKANGGTTVTNDASSTGVGSIDSVYQANTTAGFSIVTYTGSSSGNDGTASTVAHGLGAVPKWIFFLPRDAYDGCVYHEQVATDPATDKLLLKTSTYADSNTAASDDSGFFNDTEPTSTVFSVGTRKHSNSNGGMVAYCWAEVDGFSKFGSLIGNGNNDGVFVYTGFSVKWVMFKNVEATAAWIMQDTARDPFNLATKALVANFYYSESTVAARNIDFLSNGFRLRTTAGDTNNNNQNIVYMAFAEAPFKYANGR